MSKEFPINILFEISKINKSSYYKWLSLEKERAIRQENENKIIEAIKNLYEKHKGRLGVERMTNALKIEKGIYCNHKKIYRIMKENNYLSVVKRKKTFKKSGKPHPKRNVLKRNFETSCPYDKMATDVTEISMFGKKIYISPVKDLHTNMIESNEIGNHATLTMALKMIEKIKDKSIAEGTIFHSDQGSIYNSLKFQKELEKNNFIQSMSRKGTPIDNSPMESFFSTLKSEVIYNPLIKIENYEDLVREIKEYFEYYNNERIQKKLGYLTPKQFKEKELVRISMENIEN